MKIFYAILCLLGSISIGFAQDGEISMDSLDTSYKEDQFYLGITYNLLAKMPDNMSQNGFSSGFHFGFIKDMPINKRRNWAIGLGLGYSTNSVNQNLQIIEEANKTYSYQLLTSSEFSKNKFSQHLIEVPLEIRWRTSTATDYKFWRIYSGFKIGYLIASSTKFKNTNELIKLKNIESFNKVQYGLTLGIGYDSWNAYMYYALNSVFEDGAALNGQPLDVKMVKIGIMFYIL